MNRKEISYLMAIIKTAYPHYYQKTSDIEDALSLWGEMFIEDDPVLISKAVKGFIKEDTAGFPPAIGQIKDLAKGLRRKQREEFEMAEQQKRLKEPKKEPSKEDMEMASEFINKIRNSMKLPGEE